MGDCFRRHAEVQSRQGVRRILGARQRPDDIEQFFFGQADQRAAQQRAERERVTTIGEHAREGDEVLDFLAPEEAFAGLGRDRNAAPLQRFLIAPQIASRRRQESDVAGPAGAALAGLAVEDRVAADQPRTHLGDSLGFAVALLLGRRLAVGICDGNVESGDARALRRARDGMGRAR